MAFEQMLLLVSTGWALIGSLLLVNLLSPVSLGPAGHGIDRVGLKIIISKLHRDMILLSVVFELNLTQILMHLFITYITYFELW